LGAQQRVRRYILDRAQIQGLLVGGLRKPSSVLSPLLAYCDNCTTQTSKGRAILRNQLAPQNRSRSMHGVKQSANHHLAAASNMN
jgi:hypothetical protein